jgi:hypothetical protein
MGRSIDDADGRFSSFIHMMIWRRQLHYFLDDVIAGGRRGSGGVINK